MTNTEAIKVLNSYCSERYLADTSLQEACSVAVEALQAQTLSKEDYIELRNRFGTVVENVVRDMVSGKGERWEQAQADGEYISKEKAIIQLLWDLSEVELPRIKESLDKLPSVAIPSEPKTAQWIHTEECDEEWQYRCSKCNMPSKSSSHRYCSNCGSYMYGLRGKQHG